MNRIVSKQKVTHLSPLNFILVAWATVAFQIALVGLSMTIFESPALAKVSKNEQKIKKLTVTSTSIQNGKMIPSEQVFNGFGCAGANLSPELSWKGAPADTKAFAVTVYDPDAPTGSGWWHWVLFNLPPETTQLAAGVGTEGHPALPPGAIQGKTDFGKAGYGGPCPPPGHKPHRYLFRVFALKDKLPLNQDSSPAMVGFYINQLKIAEGGIEAKYGR